MKPQTPWALATRRRADWLWSFLIPKIPSRNGLASACARHDGHWSLLTLCNDAVNANNARIQSFARVPVANRDDFPAARLLQFHSEQTADVGIKALFAK